MAEAADDEEIGAAFQCLFLKNYPSASRGLADDESMGRNALGLEPARAAGASVPLAAAYAAPASLSGLSITLVSVLSLAILGYLAARTGGAQPVMPALRVAFWGIAAMGLTAAVGYLFGATVG